MDLRGDGVFPIYEYDLHSENWREPIPKVNALSHFHLLDLVKSDVPMKFNSTNSEENCVFCQANLTHDRSLEEILYHFLLNYESDFNEDTPWHKTLIDKWKNNEDAWDNPIGNNIKG